MLTYLIAPNHFIKVGNCIKKIGSMPEALDCLFMVNNQTGKTQCQGSLVLN
jgi:hypothetical protein